jgi:hypothetical protein
MNRTTPNHPRLAPVVLTICAAFLITACGAKYAPEASALMAGGSGAQYSRVYAESAMDSLEAAPAIPQGADGPGDEVDYGANPNEAERKLVKTAGLRVRVENLEAVDKPLGDLLEKYRAWSASTAVYENSRSYTLRMPTAFYETFLADLGTLGRVLSKTENAEDVTLQYYDLEGRLATKQELLKTFQAYLSKAKDIDEIMTVEQRISELQQEIDWTGTRLRNLAHLVDYSTIELELLGPVTAVNYYEPSLGERFKELFGSFGEVVSGALVVITGIIIYGVPALLVLVLLFWLFFGRVGLFKKLWRLAAGRKAGGDR